MRRSQFDLGSQPVRNLFPNPDCERVSGTTVVRQNLMGNPRGKTVMTQYATVGAQVITGNVAITGHPEGITTANRFTYGGTTPSNPGVQFFNGTPGTNYTFSAWIYIESLCTTPGNTGWAESGILAGPNFANTVGVWQKVTWNRTPTSGNGIGIRTTAADGGSASILVTGVVIEQLPQSVASSTFFDGDTAASGDFTYAWQDTSGSGISVQRAPSVAGYSGFYSGGRIAWSSSAWSAGGSKSLAIASPRPSVDSFSQISPLPNTNGDMGGKTYTFLANLKTLEAFPAGADGRAWSININVNLAGGGQFQYNIKPTTTFAGVHEIRQAIKIRDDATSLVYMRLYNGSPNPSTVYWDNIMMVEGNYTGDYVDGAKPFSKWDGTAQASASVGYPQQLLDIAGKPDIDVVGVGSLNNTGVADPYMARTFYVVYENNGNTANYNVCASYGVIGSQGYMCQTAGTGSNSMAHRIDMPGGTFNGGLVFGNARTSKRHVVAITANQGLTNVTGCTDGGSDIGQATTPGSGWADNRVLTAATAEIKPIRFLVFNTAHDRATRLAVSRYLGNKYGAPVA